MEHKQRLLGAGRRLRRRLLEYDSCDSCDAASNRSCPHDSEMCGTPDQTADDRSG